MEEEENSLNIQFSNILFFILGDSLSRKTFLQIPYHIFVHNIDKKMLNFSFIQAVASATVILAIWMLTDPTFLVSLAQEENNYHAGLYILLAAGVLMLIVAILGCCGAFRESQCMLVGFFSCLLVVIVAQVAAGAWLYTNSERLKQLVRASAANTIKVHIIYIYL